MDDASRKGKRKTKEQKTAEALDEAMRVAVRGTLFEADAKDQTFVQEFEAAGKVHTAVATAIHLKVEAAFSTEVGLWLRSGRRATGKDPEGLRAEVSVSGTTRSLASTVALMHLMQQAVAVGALFETVAADRLRRLA